MTTWQMADNMKKRYTPWWGTRVIMAGFISFFAKGLRWLIVPLVFYGIGRVGLTDCLEFYNIRE